MRSAQSDWPTAGHDPGAQRFSPLKQINAKNVTKLQRAWTFHTGDAKDDIDSEGAPLVIDGVLYFDAGKNVYALDPITGLQIWKFETKGTRPRGLSYWPGDANTAPRIFLGVVRQSDARARRQIRQALRRIWRRRLRRRRQSRRRARHLSRPDHLR